MAASETKHLIGQSEFAWTKVRFIKEVAKDRVAMFRYQQHALSAEVLSQIELWDRLHSRGTVSGKDFRFDLAFGWILQSLLYLHKIPEDNGVSKDSVIGQGGWLAISRKEICKIVGRKTLDGSVIRLSPRIVTRCLQRAEEMGFISLVRERNPDCERLKLFTRFTAENLSQIGILRRQWKKSCKRGPILRLVGEVPFSPHLGRRLSKLGLFSNQDLLHAGLLLENGSFYWFLTSILDMFAVNDPGCAIPVQFTSLKELSERVSAQAARGGVTVKFSTKTISRLLKKCVKHGVLVRHQHHDKRSRKAASLKIEFNSNCSTNLRILLDRIIREDLAERRKPAGSRDRFVVVDCLADQDETVSHERVLPDSPAPQPKTYREEMLGTAAEQMAAAQFKNNSSQGCRSTDITRPAFPCTTISPAESSSLVDPFYLKHTVADSGKIKNYALSAAPPGDCYFRFKSRGSGKLSPSAESASGLPLYCVNPVSSGLQAEQRIDASGTELFPADSRPTKANGGLAVDHHQALNPNPSPGYLSTPGRLGKTAYYAQLDRLDAQTMQIARGTGLEGELRSPVETVVDPKYTSRVTIFGKDAKDLPEKLKIIAECMPERLALLSRKNIRRVSRIALNEILVWQKFVTNNPSGEDWFARTTPNPDPKMECAFADFLFRCWRGIYHAIKRSCEWEQRWFNAKENLEKWEASVNAWRDHIEIEVKNQIQFVQRRYPESLLSRLDFCHTSPELIFATLFYLEQDLLDAIATQRKALQEWAKRNPIEFFKLSEFLPIKTWAAFSGNMLSWLSAKARQQFSEAYFEKFMAEFYGCGPGAGAERARFIKMIRELEPETTRAEAILIYGDFCHDRANGYLSIGTY